MSKCNEVPPEVSKAGKSLSTSKSKKVKKEASKILKEHQTKEHQK